jgi:hypothetical protein
MCQADECCCGYPVHHGPGVGHHQWGCCCTPDFPPRRFPTREETISQLEEYLKNLQAEAEGVKERIAELKKG